MYIISTIGLCLIIVDGAIMEKPRQLFKSITNKMKIPFFGDVVDCYLCSGTWAGFFMGFVWISHNLLEILACGFAGSFLCHSAAIILNWVEAATIIHMPEDK